MIFEKLKTRENFNIELDLCIEILRVYNPRISEILSCPTSNYYPGRFLILEGKKKSNNVIIRDPNILQIVDFLIKDGRNYIFQNLNYQLVKREVYRRYGYLITKIYCKKNKKVTHIFRYLNIDNLEKDEYIRDVLHHRSISSGMFYKNKLRRNNNGGN